MATISLDVIEPAALILPANLGGVKLRIETMDGPNGYPVVAFTAPEPKLRAFIKKYMDLDDDDFNEIARFTLAEIKQIAKDLGLDD